MKNKFVDVVPLRGKGYLWFYQGFIRKSKWVFFKANCDCLLENLEQCAQDGGAESKFRKWCRQFSLPDRCALGGSPRVTVSQFNLHLLTLKLSLSLVVNATYPDRSTHPLPPTTSLKHLFKVADLRTKWQPQNPQEQKQNPDLLPSVIPSQSSEQLPLPSTGSFLPLW